MKLRYILMAAVSAGVLATACSSKTTATTEGEALTPVDIIGTFDIVSVKVNDTTAVNVAEIADLEQVPQLNFTDSTYSARTNCNTIFGDYYVNGDSISFADGGMTRMACPDTRIEDYMLQALPQINKIVVVSDSLTRLVSDGAACIELKPAK